MRKLKNLWWRFRYPRIYVGDLIPIETVEVGDGLFRLVPDTKEIIVIESWTKDKVSGLRRISDDGLYERWEAHETNL